MSMKIRRAAAQKDAVKNAEELIPFSEVLDKPSGGMTMERDDVDPLPASAPPSGPGSNAPLSLESRFESESNALRLKQWKEGHFAANMTTTTWREEYANYRSNFREKCLNIDAEDGSPCNCCSALVCGAMGAGRIGNMAVLKQSTEWVEEMEEDENGETKIRRFTRPRLDVVVGPYWPMLLCVTYPLIFGVSIATLVTAIPGKHPVVILFWASCTMALIVALGMTAFRDPGILPRYEKPPPQQESSWRWSDRAHSYRPQGAFFDPDTGVVVEGFDHTCPWTGTAIGERNMTSFQCFVGLVFLCLMFDIVLLTGGLG